MCVYACLSIHYLLHQGSSFVVEFLYLNGGKLSVVDQHGKSSLHYAVMQKDNTLVMMLIKRGVTPMLEDFEGKNPIDYALDDESRPHIITM